MLADVLGRSNAHNYSKPFDVTTLLKPLIGSHNLFVSDGIEHERARKMLNPAFHFDNLQSMVSIIVDRTNKAISSLLISSVNQPIDLQRELNALALSIIASCAFGQGFDTVANAKEIVGHTFTQVLDTVMHRTMRMINLIPLLARFTILAQAYCR